MNKALEHLDGMMNANMELYEKILDTPGFAYHFNELVKLAQSAAQHSEQPSHHAAAGDDFGYMLSQQIKK